MKTIFVLMSLLVLPVSLFAGVKLPKGVYTSEDFEEGQAKAVEKNLPIAFVYTNLGSS